MFGYIVLFGWPVVVAILFKACNKPTAILASLIAGYLLLPERLNLNLPLLPELNKHSIPALSSFFILLIIDGRQDPTVLPGWLPKRLLPRMLIALFVIGAFLTVMTNGDAFSYGPRQIPALRPFDAFSSILTTMITLLPFLLARKYLAHPEQQRTLLIALTIAGCLYAFLALYEIRMSPQLNNTVYGFFPHSWRQHIRGDGYRPLVFLIHGLRLAIFFVATILAAFGLFRSIDDPQRYLFLFAGLWILMTLTLSRSLGALVIALALIPMVLFLRPRLQMLICAVIAVVALSYPALRDVIIPIDVVVSWAESFSAERAHSLKFRLQNEDVLLDRALQRPLFGWGGWDRSSVFDDYGHKVSIPDGYWIGVMGQGGWVRYISEIGLLCVPVGLLLLRARKMQFNPETSVFAIILTATLIDLIPNDGPSTLIWMVAGSIWGRIELGRLSDTKAPEPHDISPSRNLAYTRFGKGSPTQNIAKKHFRLDSTASRPNSQNQFNT